MHLRIILISNKFASNQLTDCN